MTTVEAMSTVVGLVYAGANIGLLCSIKFDLGRLSSRQEDHSRRITKLEGKHA